MQNQKTTGEYYLPLLLQHMRAKKKRGKQEETEQAEEKEAEQAEEEEEEGDRKKKKIIKLEGIEEEIREILKAPESQRQ